MLFSTERLIIRNHIPDDIEPFYEMQSNPNVLRFVPKSETDRASIEADFKRFISFYDKPDNDFWVWAIIRKSDNAYVGTCALIKHESTEDGKLKIEDEIGYRFLEKYWGNGYGNEVTPALLKYGFEKMGMTEIMAEVDQLNTASVKILGNHMNFVKAFYNERDKSNDRLYRITKDEFGL